MQLTISAVLVAAACGATSASAQRPPPLPAGAIGGTTTKSFAPSSALVLGPFRVELETTTLAEVRHAIGAGIISHEGDASESVYWLCYTVSAGSTPSRIWMMSNEISGGEVIDSISAQLSLDFRPLDTCPQLPEIFTPVRLERGLWLGNTEKQVTAMIGTPSNRHDEWVSFEFQEVIPGNCEGGYDVRSALTVRIVKDAVVDMRAFHLTSC